MTAANSRHRLAVFGLIAAVMALSLALVAPAGASAAEPTVTIEFEGSGEGTIECEVNGESPEPCEEGVEEFTTGDEVNIYAEEEAGSEFIEFGGSCGPLVCELGELEENENYVVTVLFEAEPVYLPLTILSTGGGFGEVECEVEGGGAEECQDEYLEGTELNLVAEEEEGSEFVEWGGDCEAPVENECEVEMDEEKTVEVVFNLEPELFKLNIEPQGNGAGEVICETEEGPEECQEEYPAGTDVYLIAQAETGSEFVAWEGECDAVEGNECEVEMSEEKTVEPVFHSETPEEEFELEVSVTGEGEVNAEEPPEPTSGGISGCEEVGGECSAEYTEGDVVTLVATPEGGWETAGWTGCTEIGADECEVTMDEDKSVSVEFEEIPVPEEFELEVEVTGNGKVSANTGAISECRESSGVCSDEYLENTEVTLTETPDGGNEFLGWTGCNSEPSATTCKVTMDEAKSVEAEFGVEVAPEEFELEVEVTGNGKVSANTGAISECRESSGVCSDEYLENTEVTLTETPDGGNEFLGWTGCNSEPSATTCKVTMDEAKSVEAEFGVEVAPEEFELSVSKSGTGSGTVTSSPPGINCGATCEDEFVEGTVVHLTATPASGSEFVKWTGACTGSGACTVTMTGAKSVGAEFAVEPEEEESGGGGGGNSGGGGSSGGGSTPPPPPTPKADPLIANPVIAVKGNKAQIKVKCRGDEGARCRGVAKLIVKVKQHGKKKNLVIGKTSFNLPTGSSLRVIRAKLTGQGVQLVKKAGSKGLAATISGNGVRSRSVKLKLQGGNKKHKRSHRRNHRRH